MHQVVHEPQDQYVSVRRPHSYASQRGIADGINYMQMNHVASWFRVDIDSGKEWGWLIWTVAPFTTTTFIFDPLYSSSKTLPRMVERCAFVFEAESSSLRVILAMSISSRIAYSIPYHVLTWLSSSVSMTKRCHSTQIWCAPRIEIDDLLHAWTLFSYIELQP